MNNKLILNANSVAIYFTKLDFTSLPQKLLKLSKQKREREYVKERERMRV